MKNKIVNRALIEILKSYKNLGGFSFSNRYNKVKENFNIKIKILKLKGRGMLINFLYGFTLDFFLKIKYCIINKFILG